MRMLLLLFTLFFFNDPATTEIYTLSLHDALPIYPPASRSAERRGVGSAHHGARYRRVSQRARRPVAVRAAPGRAQRAGHGGERARPGGARRGGKLPVHHGVL